MNKRILIIIAFLHFLSFSQEKIKIEKVIVKPTLSFQSDNEIPKVIPLNKKYEKSANEINNVILDRYFLTSYELKEDEEFRYSGSKFESVISDEYVFIKISGGYLGPYPSEFEEEFIFTIETGDIIPNIDFPFHSLFSLNGYLEFLNKYWLEDAKKEFYFPEDDEYCGGAKPYCTYYDIEKYIVENKKIKFELTYDCFPRVARACTPFVSKQVSIDTLNNYLSENGKILINKEKYTLKKGIEKFKINQKITPRLKNNIFFFGKINKKYPFSMAINIDNHNQINGFYWYDNQLKKIELKGKKIGDKFLINESYNGKPTGSFEFLLTKEYNDKGFFVYDPNGNDNKYLTGKWSNLNNKKVFEIEFYEMKSNIKN